MLCQQQHRTEVKKLKSNADIRAMAKAKGVMLWQIAEAIGINDGNFSRKLRRELPTAEKAEIMSIIDELSAAKQKEKSA